MYTEEFGLQGYVVNSVRSAKGKNKIALFQPLTLLELVVYHNPKKELHRLAEIKCPQPLESIPYAINKTTQGIFINEVLIKTLKEHTSNPELFFFLYEGILTLDQAGFEDVNFHLKFLLRLSRYLGFAPEEAREIYAQLEEAGLFLEKQYQHEEQLNKLIQSAWDTKILIPASHKNDILNAILKFYELHQESFGSLKSLSVLREVLH